MLVLVALSVVALLAVPAGAQNGASEEPAGVIKEERFKSSILNRELAYDIYLPPSYAKSKDRRYPVIYFLHGLYRGHKVWADRGCNDVLDALIARGKALEMVVAMPEGQNSFYTNAINGGGRWEDYIVQDFIPFIEKTWRVLDTRDGRAISGDSAGGYGALKIAWKHPRLFCAVATHSAILLPSKVSEMPAYARQSMSRTGRIFGNPIDEEFWSKENPLTLARERASEIKGQRIYFDCGTGDRYGFAPGTEQLHEILKAQGIEHEHALLPGDHGREYLKAYIERSLVFISDAFRASGAGSK